nr:DEAD/DEAH box helicase [Solirubrobacterales bacterium]
MVGLDTPVRGVVGQRTTTALTRAFGIQTVGDPLTHFPRRLHDRGQLTDFGDLQVGEHVTVLAKTVSVKSFTYRPKTGGQATRTEVVVTDGHRQLLLTFFRQPWKAGELKTGTVALFSGMVNVFRRQRQLLQPTCDVLPGHDLDDDFSDEAARRWLPIYPATSAVSSMQIMRSVELALDALSDVADPLPDKVRGEHRFLSYRAALEAIHRPTDQAQWQAAAARLRFDEAFVLQTVLAQRRRLIAMLPAAPRPARGDGLRGSFEAQLPFMLTAGQREIDAELSSDLGLPHPMHRLLQGEVGSGKTVLALLAMLQVVDAGGQAALLAPTEVLAAQHYRSIRILLGPLADAGMLGGADDATAVALLTGSMPAGRRREALLQAASGGAGIVVGTHALLEDRVQFADLGLVVIDEQHRFGVEQRAALTDKAGFTPPHVLVMTATPIPRTVAITVFGDLDVSTL